jgi:hypothetical protein
LRPRGVSDKLGVNVSVTSITPSGCRLRSGRFTVKDDLGNPISLGGSYCRTSRWFRPSRSPTHGRERQCLAADVHESASRPPHRLLTGDVQGVGNHAAGDSRRERRTPATTSHTFLRPTDDKRSPFKGVQYPAQTGRTSLDRALPDQPRCHFLTTGSPSTAISPHYPAAGGPRRADVRRELPQVPRTSSRSRRRRPRPSTAAPASTRPATSANPGRTRTGADSATFIHRLHAS